MAIIIGDFDTRTKYFYNMWSSVRWEVDTEFDMTIIILSIY